MKIPVVLSAFGTTTRALDTYKYIDERCKEALPACEIHWAYSSNMVKHRLKKGNVNLKTPYEVLQGIGDYTDWAVLQSMHLICGHEFNKLTDEAGKMKVRTSIGLPLLYSPADYQKVAEALKHYFEIDEEEAVIFVGHGTDHASWVSYPALSIILKKLYGKRAFVGVVEKFPGEDVVLSEVKEKGFKKVRLVPLMLVAGVHFKEDLAGEEDSWKCTFEEHGIKVSLEKEGLGYNNKVIDIFIDHIKSALDLIPANGRQV